MERPNTVAGLKAKRKELRQEMRRLAGVIRALDTAIRLFDEGRSGRKRLAPRGARQAFIFDYMRRANGPVTSAQVTKAWLRSHGIRLSPEERNEIRRKIREAFSGFESRGYVRHCGYVGLAKLWTLADIKCGPG